MKDHISYTFNKKVNQRGDPPHGPDKRLMALVRFIARRAAERDYKALLKSGASPFAIEKERGGPS